MRVNIDVGGTGGDKCIDDDCGGWALFLKSTGSVFYVIALFVHWHLGRSALIFTLTSGKKKVDPTKTPLFKLRRFFFFDAVFRHYIRRVTCIEQVRCLKNICGFGLRLHVATLGLHSRSEMFDEHLRPWLTCTRSNVWVASSQGDVC